MEQTKHTVALIGNPNSGKTTIFNALTGSTQHTGNWPGVTVEKKTGRLLQYRDVELVDLPGTYSLGAYSEDETVTRNYILHERPHAIIDVVDASNLKRNLYLTVLLMELGENLVLAVNMLDAARRRNADVDVQKLGEILGIPAVATVGIRSQGMRELADAAYAASNHPRKYLRIDYGHELESHLLRLEKLIDEKNVTPSHIPSRYLAIRLLEGNEEFFDLLRRHGLTQEEEEGIRREIRHLESIFREDLESVIIEKRYGYIESVIKAVVKKTSSIERKIDISDRIDRVVLNKYLSLPIFLLIMYVMFQMTFGIGGFLAEVLDGVFAALGTSLAAVIENPLLSSFLVEGVLGGLGSILIFVPNIFLLFLVMSFLEDSGYMARGAYIMDRFMRSLGLQGKAFIPMLTGFGCNVPGVMATRTLESRSDRMVTMLINPLMSCGARLPIYVLFSSVFFPGREGLVIISLYVLGVTLAVLVAKLFKETMFRGECTPFVMELPPYRVPTLKGMFIHMWDRGSEFLKKAGTIIFAVVILIWVLSNLPWGVEYASRESLIGRLGSLMAPIYGPLGFGAWEPATALLFGVVAKEVVVATLGTLYVTEGGLSAAVLAHWTPLSAYSFMVMTLLYTPCVATLAAIRKESGTWRWMLFSIGYSFVLAWLVSFLIFRLGLLLGLG